MWWGDGENSGSWWGEMEPKGGVERGTASKGRIYGHRQKDT